MAKLNIEILTSWILSGSTCSPFDGQFEIDQAEKSGMKTEMKSRTDKKELADTGITH